MVPSAFLRRIWSHRDIFLAVAAIALTVVAFWPHSGPQPMNVSVEASSAPEVSGAATHPITITGKVRAYGSAVKSTLALPTSVVADAHKQVVSATQVKRSEHPQTITTVLDTATGQSTNYVKVDPYPWLAVDRRGEARLSYGYKYSPDTGLFKPVARLSATYDVVRIKALTAGFTGSIDTDGALYAGVGVAYRW